MINRVECSAFGQKVPGPPGQNNPRRDGRLTSHGYDKGGLNAGVRGGHP